MLFVDGESEQFLFGSIEDVAVYDVFSPSTDSVDMSGVGILPEFPRPFVLELVYIVMCNPIRVGIKDGVAEVFHLKGIACVDDGLDSVVLFHDIEPLFDSFFEFLLGEVSFVLHVKYGWKVSSLKVHLAEKEACLLSGVCLRAEEVVGAAWDFVLFCLIEVLVEVWVDEVSALGGLDEDKADGLLADVCVAQSCPVDVFLVSADVNASNFKAIGVYSLAVDGIPSEGEGVNEILEEYEDVNGHSGPDACDDGPKRYASVPTGGLFPAA